VLLSMTRCGRARDDCLRDVFGARGVLMGMAVLPFPWRWGVHQGPDYKPHQGAPLHAVWPTLAETACGRNVDNGISWCWCEYHWPGTYKRERCRSCERVLRTRKNSLTKEKTK